MDHNVVVTILVVALAGVLAAGALALMWLWLRWAARLDTVQEETWHQR